MTPQQSIITLDRMKDVSRDRIARLQLRYEVELNRIARIDKAIAVHERRSTARAESDVLGKG